MPEPEKSLSLHQIDRALLQLFEQRARQVVAEHRHSATGVVGRVSEAAKRIDQLVKSESGSVGSSVIPPCLSVDAKASVLRHLSSVCLQTMHELRAAYLGPQYSYTHLAAIKFFGDATSFTPVATIPAVFDAVQRGDVAAGVVPIENSTDGGVVDTLGMFVTREMEICGEVLMPIHHNLLSKSPREKITEVRSKPQALSQCREWLARNLPAAKLVEVSSTAAAAELASCQPGVAAVASFEAGREYELDVIDKNIEDNPNNVTRFAVLGKERPGRTGDDKTSVLFQVTHKPGALADAMMVFKNHSLNLTWIESFPSPAMASEYLFFIELSGHRDDVPVAEAIAQLQSQSQRLTILGSYPKAKIG